jgi:hypothetical protein
LFPVPPIVSIRSTPCFSIHFNSQLVVEGQIIFNAKKTCPTSFVFQMLRFIDDNRQFPVFAQLATESELTAHQDEQRTVKILDWQQGKR